MKNKSFLFFIVLAALLLLSYNSVFAALPEERPLEINYPQLNGQQPTTVSTPIPQYVVYIFNFLVWATGIFAFFILVYAGAKYLTSAGNIERTIDAKSQIWAALLGMIILFGSYLILISINPQLIAFNLPTLKPIISSLAGGVYLCKENPIESGGDAIIRTWDLYREYNESNPAKDRQKQIQQEIDLLLNKINSVCYLVPGQGDIRPDFDNKSKFIYFVPELKFDKDGNTTSQTEYGAIVYDGQKSEGISDPIMDHLLDIEGYCDVYFFSLSQLKVPSISSIKPFRLNYNPDENWEAILYQEPNMNKGFTDLEPEHYNIKEGCGDSYWCPWSGFEPPRSIKISGNLLAILITPDNRSDSFFADDNDLENNLNLVDWVSCKDYEGENPHTKGLIFKDCAQAAANDLILISGAIY